MKPSFSQHSRTCGKDAQLVEVNKLYTVMDCEHHFALQKAEGNWLFVWMIPETKLGVA